MTQLVRLETLDDRQKEAVRQLWNENYPASLALKSPEDLDKYLDGLSGLQHWIIKDAVTVAEVPMWAFTFGRDNATWFAIIIDTEMQGVRIGTSMLDVLKRHNEELNGWVIDHDTELKLNGEPYRSPLAFYLKNNFEVLASERLETPAISAVKIRWKKN